MLPCWMYGELYKARNDFLHGNPITGERLIVRPSQRSLFLYTAPLYRLALTGFLDLRFKRTVPLRQNGFQVVPKRYRGRDINDTLY